MGSFSNEIDEACGSLLSHGWLAVDDVIAERAAEMEGQAGRMAPHPRRAEPTASDLAQSAWVKYLEARRSGKAPRPEERRAAAYMGRILRNKAWEAFRRARFLKNGGAAKIVPLEVDVAGSGTSPSGRMRREEREDCLARAMLTLNDQERRVLTLTMVEGKTPVEAAKLMNFTDRYVRQLRSQAIEHLRVAYEAMGGEADFS